MITKCKCEEIFELEGNEALDYIDSHLQKINVNGKEWEITYKCPFTDLIWIKDYPHSEYHGGGSPRLRKLPLKE